METKFRLTEPFMPTVDLTDDMLFTISTGETITWGEYKLRNLYDEVTARFPKILEKLKEYD